MSLKKLGVALLAVFVLGAIAANSAFAAGEYSETGGAWYVGGSKLAEGTTKSLSTTAVGTQKLETTIGKEAPVALKLTATGVNCSGCVIKNVGTSAKAEGALEFTGVAVAEPANCSTTSTITTKALTAVVGMNTAATQATLKFTPTAGGTAAFATVELTGEKCSIAGLYKVTGTAFAKAAKGTGEFAKTQEISLSKTIQESAGSPTSLKFGENAAILTGGVTGSIGGTEFGAKEK